MNGYERATPEPKNLTDAQYMAIVAQFGGQQTAVPAMLAELGIQGNLEAIETELWVDGFKQCPGCGIWHENLWHGRCDSCRRVRATCRDESLLEE